MMALLDVLDNGAGRLPAMPTVPGCGWAPPNGYPCFRRRDLIVVVCPGGLPERPMGADCKSVAKATEVRILYPPPPARQGPSPAETAGRGLLRRSHSVSLGTA